MRFFNPPGTKILIVTPDCEFIHYLCHGSQLEMLTRSRSRLRRSFFLLFLTPPKRDLAAHIDPVATAPGTDAADFTLSLSRMVA